MKAKKIIMFMVWMLVFVGVVYVVVRAGSVRDKVACGNYTIRIEVDYGADTILYPADIEKIMLEHDSIIGKPFNEIDIYMLESILKEHPYISEVIVFGDASETLHFTVAQRTPIVRIINKLNETFYLDETGKAMPVPERTGTSARLITVSGNINISREQAFSDTLKNVWDDLLTCVKYINQDTFLKSQTGQIYIDKEGSYLLIPVIGNHIIILGNPENPEIRMERLKILYKQGMDEEKWKTYKTIDLRYKNQIICKK